MPQTKAVIGPGTGLGVAALIRANGLWIPMGGEGGHVDVGPRTDRETAIWHHLDRFDGRVSAESLSRGPALVGVYKSICRVDDVEPQFSKPDEVSAAAQEGSSPQAVEALDLFCTVAGARCRRPGAHNHGNGWCLHQRWHCNKDSSLFTKGLFP